MSVEDAMAFVDELNRVLNAIEVSILIRVRQSSQKISIAAIDAGAYGGGAELALSCDLRVCGTVRALYGVGPNACFALPETGLAIIPGAGGTQKLKRLAGVGVAKRMILAGERISGKDLVSHGIAEYYSQSATQKALEVAGEIARKGVATTLSVGPLAIIAAKAALNHNPGRYLAHHLGHSASGMQCERDQYQIVLRSKDRIRALEAFASKISAEFKGD